MKQVEVSTAQNVTIQYPLASIGDRIFAFFIDLFIVLFTIGILRLLIMFIFGIHDQEILLTSVLILIPGLFYHLFMEAFGGGRSFGKKFLAIKPIKQNSEQMTFSDCLMRWVFRLPDILLSMGSMAVIMITSSSKSQRLGDFLAETVVIKTIDVNKPRLDQILKINERQDSFVPTYPQVRQLADKDILLIKEVISRHNKFNNESTLLALTSVVEKAESHLRVKSPKNKIGFLKDIVRDYVFMTR
ncbi:MAG: RDD family protein [Bacteroidales bacterium]|nr:RDD family protein [Bacteroidales bacterium]